MKIIGLCRKCNGDGYIKRYSFFKKECPACLGSGKYVQTLQEYRSQ